MAILKLTKNELRSQQNRLALFDRYLPTLQLKKAMLQFEVQQVLVEIGGLRQEFGEKRQVVEQFAGLLMDKSAIDPLSFAEVVHVKKHYENIAGVEIPVFDEVLFAPSSYDLLDTPLWVDSAVDRLRDLVTSRERVAVAEEKKRALEKELREVSIRVNLFEKNLIPRAEANIKKIKVFLGDQQLAAVAQAKVAKQKIKAAAE